MRKLVLIFALSIFGLCYSQEVPKVLKTGFSKEALNQKLEDEDGKSTTIQQILDQHKGKVLVIDFWAGWCRDCLKALPKAKELEENNKNIDFVFLSLDRSKEGLIKVWKDLNEGQRKLLVCFRLEK
jgi:thiol-disulfide isomerase/thioredoxin